MSAIRALSILALLLSWPAAALAQSSFAPLDQWSAAVAKGDTAAIAAFYSVSPPAQSRTPAGTSQDASEEPRFWASLIARGLANLNPKVLEILKPQAGTVALVLRIEFTLLTDSGPKRFIFSGSQTWLEEGAGDWRIISTVRGDPVPWTPHRLPEPATPNPNLYPAPEDAPADLAAKYNVPLKKGVPALAVLDSDGTLLYSQQQGEFEDSYRIGPADVTAFLEKWKPPRATVN